MKLFAYFVCLLLAITSCGGSDSGPSSEPTHAPTPAKVAVTGVTVNKASLTLMEGAAEDITATITPDNASNKNVSWKTDDPNVATVSGGKITAVGPGITTITVTTSDGSKTATIIVTVTMDVPGRQKRALLALFEKTGGTSWTNKTGWNTDIPYKEWYGVKTSGDYVTEIDLTGNNLTGTLPDGIQNLSKLTKLILANNNLTGAIPPTWGEKTSATTKSVATTRDSNEVPKLADLKTLDLSNNKLSGEIPVALGNLTALTTLKLDHNKLTGNIPASLANLSILTTLTIAHNELEGELPKEIKDSKMWQNVGDKTDLTQDNGKVVEDGIVHVTGVTLNKTSLELNIGDTETLTATVAPDTATDKTVTWSSSNTAIASVDTNGKVTAVEEGTTTISVTTKDGNKTATSKVTVKTPIIAVTGVTLNKTSLELNIGDTETLTATIAPDTATDKTVNWSSSNTAIATVDANGKVTAVAEGSATITVKTKDGEKTAECVIKVVRKDINSNIEGLGEDKQDWGN